MFSSMNVTTAFFSGLITFSLLYGAYFVLFLGSLYVLLYKKTCGQVNYVILGGTILQFVLITVCYGIRWDRVYTAFITNGDIPNGPFLFFVQLYDWREVSSTALWAVTGALGDILFIYRLYIVWDCRLHPCIAPLTLLVGTIVTTIGMICVLDKPVTTAYAVELRNWVFAFLSFNLVQNILVNMLIIVRIWRVNKRSTSLRGTSSNLWPVIIVLMESGALYSSTVFVFLVTYACQNNASMMLTDMVPPIMGIAFNIIIVRVGWSSSNRNTTSKAGANSTLVFTGNHPNRGQPYPLTDFTEIAPLPEDNKNYSDTDHPDFEYP